MMPSRPADTLFQLIHSLQKAEKRAFKLYVKRNKAGDDLKMLQLFDAIEKQTEYDESLLLRKLKFTRKDQLANRKAHLYKQILASLRLLESNEHLEIQLHEGLDAARVLYNRSLYLQSLKTLEKTKELARATHQDSYLLQALFLEKKIEGLHITRSLKDRARQITVETDGLLKSLALTAQLSNLALELYGWYINHGHVRNAEDEKKLTQFFRQNLVTLPDAPGFYHRLYAYQSFCWYGFIRIDFLLYYRYTQKWVDLFRAAPHMIEIETGHYIKGVHNLLGAHFNLGNAKKFTEELRRFEHFTDSAAVRGNQNNAIQCFLYLYTAKINEHFLTGRFTEGLHLVPELTEKLAEYAQFLDAHRVLVFYYKIASLYFGSGDYDNAVVYLSKIINRKLGLRNDLHCYARLLHLIAHYELGNFDLLEYLTKSVYRFMGKMENLGVVEERIFLFLRQSFAGTKDDLRGMFEQLLSDLKKVEGDRTASRAFAYLDIISWLESKLRGVRVEEIIRQKYEARNKLRKAIPLA